MSALPETIERRNKILYQFFNKIFPNKITLIDTNPNSPSIIYNNETCLSCYPHNFELRFTDAPEKGKTVYAISLDTPNDYDIEKILCWYNKSVHLYMHKVKLEGSSPSIYLSGYNFIDRVNKIGKYPVFSAHHPKLYFKQSKAIEVRDVLRKEGYTVVAC